MERHIFNHIEGFELSDHLIASYIELSDEDREKLKKFLVAITGNMFKLTDDAFAAYTGKFWVLMLHESGKTLGEFDTLEEVIAYLERWEGVTV